MKERHKRIVKLERDNRKKITAAILYLLLGSAKAPKSQLELLFQIPVLTRGVIAAIGRLQDRSEELANEDSLEDSEEPSEVVQSPERARQVEVAARGLIIAIVTLAAQRDDQPLSDALEGAVEDAAARIKRLNATETFTAYNEQWRANLKDAEGEFVWDALLDKRTCSRCESLHGKSWKKISDAPGCPAHVNCRCILQFEPAE